MAFAWSGSRSALGGHGNASFGQTNAAVEQGNGMSCCKLKNCYRCGPIQKMEIFSESMNNYGRPFYKCRGCGAFSWVENDDIVTLNLNAGSSSIGGLVEEIRSVKHEVKSTGDFVNSATKIAVVMYFVLLFIVIM